MKTLLPEINSADKRFHAGNPAIGEQGTRVTDTWLNDVQDRVRDVQAEAHYVLEKAGFRPVENKQTQLYEAIVKIIDDNRKKASTTQKGEVQLTSDTGLDSEELGLTAKAGKFLAQGIAALRLAMNNYIPLKSRSSSVTSNDENGVATPKAVKIAYDKGVEAKTAADNAQSTANSKQSPATTLAGYGIGNFKIENFVGNVNTLQTDGIYAITQASRSQNLPVAGNGCHIQVIAGGDGSWCRQIAYIAYSTDMYERHQTSYQTDSWSAWVKLNDIEPVRQLVAQKANLTDFSYQKIGDFEVRKYPDGTMIQTYRFTPPNNRVGAQDKKFTFNWAVAFADKPKVWIQHNTHESSGYGSLDVVAENVENECTATKETFWVWEWYYNNHLISFDFFAIGRWKR